MRGQHLRAFASTVLAFATFPATRAAFSVDIQAFPADPHEDAESVLKRDTVYETLIQRSRVLYAANVSIGTPPQPLLCQIAVNAADTVILALNSTYCQASYAANCTDDGAFNPNASSTYQNLNSDFFQIYATANSVGGQYFTDTITIGNGTLTNQQMAIGYNTSRSLGVLGLGYAAQEYQARMTGRQYTNVPEAMADAGLINSNAYSLYINSYEAAIGSVLFGGIDTEKFEAPLMTVPLLPRPANSSDLLIPLSAVDVGPTELLRGSSLTASLDAGETFTYLPDNMARQLWDLAGATYFNGSGVAIIDCKQQENTTVINFTIADWVNLNVSIGHMVFNFNSTTCLFGITTIEDNASVDNSPDAVLGLTFLLQAYVVYDLSNQEISMAPAKLNVTSSNILEIQNGESGVPGAIRTSTASSSATSGASSGSSGSSGLSAGASAGIGVAAAAVAILLALGAFLLWRRRRKARKAARDSPQELDALATARQEDPKDEKDDNKSVKDKQYEEMGAEGNELVEAPSPWAGHNRYEGAESPRAEVAGSPPAELPGDHGLVELEGGGLPKQKR